MILRFLAFGLWPLAFLRPESQFLRIFHQIAGHGSFPNSLDQDLGYFAFLPLGLWSL